MQLLESNTDTVISIGNISANRIKIYFSTQTLRVLYIYICTYIYVHIYIREIRNIVETLQERIKF